MQNLKHDIIISGAGYIGLTLACLLAEDKSLNIAVIDKKEFNHISYHNNNSPSRLFAIASASMEIFKRIGISEELEKNAQSINQILIEDHNAKEELIFTPDEIGIKNFGYMSQEFSVLKALTEKAKQYKNIEFYFNAEVETILSATNYTTVKLSNKKILQAKLLVIAEGKNSKTREVLGIDTRCIDYWQDAIVCDIRHQNEHRGIAIEKFLADGPIAMLPKAKSNESCIVWTSVNGTGKLLNLMQKDDIKYLLKERVSRYLGDIELISDTLYFPLRLLYAKKYTIDKVVFCGDSIHNIHPIAGQGLNLGLRDIQLLDELIKENINLGLDIGSKSLLNKYSLQREFDINLMINSTHNINSIFSSNFLPVKLLRKLGLKLINDIKPIKKYIMNYASGYRY